VPEIPDREWTITIAGPIIFINPIKVPTVVRGGWINVASYILLPANKN
jgi:hypothetical protein